MKTKKITSPVRYQVTSCVEGFSPASTRLKVWFTGSYRACRVHVVFGGLAAQQRKAGKGFYSFKIQGPLAN